MAILFLVAITIALILIGVGLALGIALAALLAVASGVGMLSTATAWRILRKTPSSALRCFCYQFFLLTGSITGIAVAWIAFEWRQLPWTLPELLWLGMAPGIILGLLAGLLHSWLIGHAARFVEKRLSRRHPTFL